MNLWRSIKEKFRPGARQEPKEASSQEAVELFRSGRFEEALRYVDAMLAELPEIALSWRFRGETLFQLNRYQEAAEAFQRAQELGGRGTEDILCWKALAEANGGQIEQAKSTLRALLSSEGSEPSVQEKARKIPASLQAASTR